MRLIDRDALLEKTVPKNPDAEFRCVPVEDIKAAPIIEERKKGRWIIHPEVKNVYGGVYIECPECGEKYVVQHLEDEKFCRNCGADLRKEGGE